MSLPYENASSGDRAVTEIQKILRAFGCNKFGTMLDYETGELLVQFEHQGRRGAGQRSRLLQGIRRGMAKASPVDQPDEARPAGARVPALEIGSIAVYSVVRDWIKGQVTAIEIGMMSFEGAFLSHLLLKDGTTVIDAVKRQKMLE